MRIAHTMVNDAVSLAANAEKDTVSERAGFKGAMLIGRVAADTGAHFGCNTFYEQQQLVLLWMNQVRAPVLAWPGRSTLTQCVSVQRRDRIHSSFEWEDKSLDLEDLIAFTTFTCLHRSSLIVADDLFTGRIPLELAAQPCGDRTEVADGHGLNVTERV